MSEVKEIIIHQHCKGCGICIHVCTKKVLDSGTDHTEYGTCRPMVKNLDRCVVCRLCELYCPDFAIDVFEQEEI